MKTSLRFKIFERDNFTCQYCGQKPPNVVLHVDHIHPKSKGGGDEELNLITSCQSCNLGKKDKILKNPKKIDVSQEIENLKEAENQIKEYYKYLKKITKHKENNPIIDLICEVWTENSGGVFALSNSGKKDIKNLLRTNLAEDIIEAIKISWENSRIKDDQKFKYMCGVLRNLKLKRENPEQAKKNEQSRQAYNRLLEHWKKQRRGSNYLPDYKIKEWLENFTELEIKSRMDEAEGYWDTLKSYFE